MTHGNNTNPGGQSGVIRFDRNWNNKLSCECFTTIRLKDPLYRKGNTLKLLLLENGVYRTLGTVRILEAKPLRLHQVNEFLSRLDCGMGIDGFTQMLHGMYREKVKDLHTQDLVMLLLERVREKQLTSPLFG